MAQTLNRNLKAPGLWSWAQACAQRKTLLHASQKRWPLLRPLPLWCVVLHGSGGVKIPLNSWLTEKPSLKKEGLPDAHWMSPDVSHWLQLLWTVMLAIRWLQAFRIRWSYRAVWKPAGAYVAFVKKFPRELKYLRQDSGLQMFAIKSGMAATRHARPCFNVFRSTALQKRDRRKWNRKPLERPDIPLGQKNFPCNCRAGTFRALLKL